MKKHYLTPADVEMASYLGLDELVKDLDTIVGVPVIAGVTISQRGANSRIITLPTSPGTSLSKGSPVYLLNNPRPIGVAVSDVESDGTVHVQLY